MKSGNNEDDYFFNGDGFIAFNEYINAHIAYLEEHVRNAP